LKRSSSSKKAKTTKGANGKDMEVRERLIAVGKEHFLKAGSKGLSVRKVANEANANLGSFVYHFKTKELFIAEVLESHYGEFVDIFNAEIEKLGSFSTPLQKLECLIKKMTVFAGEKGPLVIRLLMDALQGEDAVVKALAKRPPRHIAMLIDIIKECQDQGTVRDDVEPALIYLLCVASVGLPQIFVQQLSLNFKTAQAKGLSQRILGASFEKVRIDFAMKGIAK
jgi:AcrR family transcriptional regulator